MPPAAVEPTPPQPTPTPQSTPDAPSLEPVELNTDALQESVQQSTEKVVESTKQLAEQLDQNAWLGPWLNFELLDNPVKQWLLFAIIFVGTLALLKLVQSMVLNRVANWAQRKGNWLHLAAYCLRNIHPLFYMALALSAGSLALKLPPRLDQIMDALPAIAIFLQLALFARPFMDHLLEMVVERRPTPSEQIAMRTMMGPLRFVGMLVLWSVLLLLALDNMGFDITALVAGLGVGGIAIALAVQNILGDLFAAMSIVLDKPFVLGDFIIVGDFLGTVEHIGLKTTRLRSLGGEQIIFSNTDLLGSRIRNYKRMDERRVVFKFGVLYSTTHEQLARIPVIVKEIVESVELTRFDRAHFAALSASSLDFEVVYFVLDPDYNKYMDIQQIINLAIFKRVQEEVGTSFAFPTHTISFDEQTSQLVQRLAPNSLSSNGKSVATSASSAASEGQPA